MFRMLRFPSWIREFVPTKRCVVSALVWMACWFVLLHFVGVVYAEEGEAARGVIISVEMLLSGILSVLTLVVGGIVKVLISHNEEINELEKWTETKDQLWALEIREMMRKHGDALAAEVKEEFKAVRRSMNEGFQKGHERFQEFHKQHEEKDQRLERLEQRVGGIERK